MKVTELIKDLEEAHDFKWIVLNCYLRGKYGYHRPKDVLQAEITRLSDRNHVLMVGQERFGVYAGYYQEVE